MTRLLTLAIADPNALPADLVVSTQVFGSIEALKRRMTEGWRAEAEFDCRTAPPEDHEEIREGYEENVSEFLRFVAEHPDFFEDEQGEEAVWKCENEDLFYNFEWSDLEE